MSVDNLLSRAFKSGPVLAYPHIPDPKPSHQPAQFPKATCTQHSFNKQLQHTHCAPGPGLGAGESLESKTGLGPGLGYRQGAYTASSKHVFIHSWNTHTGLIMSQALFQVLALLHKPLNPHTNLCTHAQSLSRVRLLAAPWTVAHQAPLSLGFSRQKDWSGQPCPSPGDLHHPGIELGSPSIAGRFFTIWATREAPKCPSNLLCSLTWAILLSLSPGRPGVSMQFSDPLEFSAGMW